MNNQEKFYSRQVKLIGHVGQEKISSTRILVIGAGGLGCPVLIYLAAMGVGHIGIIDNDIVDASNLHRQILYTPQDMGEPKSKMAALKLREQNPYITVEYFHEKLNSLRGEELFKNYDIIVDCTDNFETKFLVHDLCYSLNKKLVQASIYQYEGQLHVFDFSLKDESTPCLRCLWSKQPEDGCTGTCVDVGVLGATVGVLGSMQAMEVSKLILDKWPLKNGESLFVDLLSHDYEKRRWNKNLDCPLCSANANVKREQDANVYKISFDKVSGDFIWIDIRGHAEVEASSIDHPGILHIPLPEFDISKLNLENKYLLICQKGFRSNQAARSLREQGLLNFYSLIDGMLNFK